MSVTEENQDGRTLLALLAVQLGAEPASVAVCLWPQVMASAREQLIPWIDRNVPGLAAPTRLAFQDLDVVADELHKAVRGAWRRLRAVLTGQSALFVGVSDGGWAVRVTSQLCAPWPAGGAAVELTSEVRLATDTQVSGLTRCGGRPVDILRVRDGLLSYPPVHGAR